MVFCVCGEGIVEKGGCGEYQLQTCDNFNKFLMLEEEFSLVMIAHHPDNKIEDIIASGNKTLMSK
jgi:hypothetical protein